jgi:hypothetical protein
VRGNQQIVGAGMYMQMSVSRSSHGQCISVRGLFTRKNKMVLTRFSPQCISAWDFLRRDIRKAISPNQSGGGRPPPLPCPERNGCNWTTARRTHGQETVCGYRLGICYL